MREVVNGVMYVLSTGCQWRALPKDLPPRSTVNGYFDLCDWDGTLERILRIPAKPPAYSRVSSPTDSDIISPMDSGVIPPGLPGLAG